MRKRVQFNLIVVTCCIVFLAGVFSPLAQAFDPSFPTRTPTPGSGEQPPDPTATESDPGTQPGDPTATATPGSSGSANPTQTPTVQAPGTGQGAATATSLPVLGGSIRANPSGGGECSDTPYVRALKIVVVYGGPGVDFGPVSTLQPEEMRPMTGRYGYGPWWQIQVKPGMLGWVTDAEVDEFGNTALVPLVEPPAINGATPTRGPLWNPTPLPLLTCVPTPTPTVTPTGSATPEATATEAAAVDSGVAGGSPPDTASADMVSAEIVATPVSQSEAAAQTADTSAQGSGISSRGSESNRAASPTSATNLILPLAGLALIAGGIALALLSRNRGETKSNDQPS